MFDSKNSGFSPVSETKTQRMSNSSAKRKKQIKRKSIFNISAVGGVILVLIILACAFFLRIDTVEIENTGDINACYSDDEIISAVKGLGYMNLLTVNTGKLVEKLETALPYLEGSEAEKNFRGFSLTVRPVYAEPTFLYFNEKTGAQLILSADCKILGEASPAFTGGLAELSGKKLISAETGSTAEFYDEKSMDDTKDIPVIVSSFIDTLKSADVGKITKFDISDLRSIKVELKDGGTLMLGSYDTLSRMKTSFIKKLHDEVAAEGIENKYIIYLNDTKTGYIRHLDEPVTEEETTAEPVTEEETTAEPVTEEETTADMTAGSSEDKTAEYSTGESYGEVTSGSFYDGQDNGEYGGGYSADTYPEEE